MNAIHWSEKHAAMFPATGVKVGFELDSMGQRIATILDDPRSGFRWRRSDAPGDEDRGHWHKVAPLDALPHEGPS
jgi:hypothetical protein